jgi:hypothetical protein
VANSRAIVAPIEGPLREMWHALRDVEVPGVVPSAVFR